MNTDLLPRLVNLLALPTDIPGRRRSYHRAVKMVGAVLLVVVLLAPIWMAGVIAVAVFLAWWFTDSLHREGR